jgi:hypothetical protein
MVYDVGLKFQCEEVCRTQIFTKENLRSRQDYSLTSNL